MQYNYFPFIILCEGSCTVVKDQSSLLLLQLYTYLLAMSEQKLEAAILGCYIVIVHPANFVVDQGGSVSLSEDSIRYCLALGLLPHSQYGKSLQFTLQVPQTVIYFIIELKFSFVLISCLPVTILRNGPTTSLVKQQDGTRSQTSYFGCRVIII